MLVGYARTSTTDQQAGLEAQQRDLLATGCKQIFSETISSVRERPEFIRAQQFVREGDTLCCTKLDRLARSTTDLLSIVGELEKKGVALRILDFGGQAVDTQSPTGRLMLTVVAAMAQWEREIMLARQREGIAKAKAEGRYRGRAPTARAKITEMRQLRDAGVGGSEIARRLSVSRASVYRLLAEADAR